MGVALACGHSLHLQTTSTTTTAQCSTCISANRIANSKFIHHCTTRTPTKESLCITPSSRQELNSLVASSPSLHCLYIILAFHFYLAPAHKGIRSADSLYLHLSDNHHSHSNQGSSHHCPQPVDLVLRSIRSCTPLSHLSLHLTLFLPSSLFSFPSLARFPRHLQS